MGRVLFILVKSREILHHFVFTSSEDLLETSENFVLQDACFLAVCGCVVCADVVRAPDGFSVASGSQWDLVPGGSLPLRDPHERTSPFLSPTSTLRYHGDKI